jgi:hypothetical protein
MRSCAENTFAPREDRAGPGALKLPGLHRLSIARPGSA